MLEIWKDIKGYEGLYQVSNLGRVKGLTRKIKLKQYIKIMNEQLIKPITNEKGYLYVSLYKNGIKKAFRVHRLVAETFIKNPNNYKEINHMDGNKQNNSVENLEYCTRSINMKHAYSIGLMQERKK